MMDVMFNGVEGPLMEGTWYNPRTKDHFVVRESFFEDNQFVVQTMDGRLLKYSQIQDYVKWDQPIPKNDPIENLPKEVENIIAPASDTLDILPEDLELLSGKPLGNLHTPKVEYQPPVMTNGGIIEKALSKRSLPDIQVKIDWKNFPKQEINMLMDLMDVSKSEIVEWYVSKVDINTIAECLRQTIEDYSSKQLSGVETCETKELQKEKVKTPEKKLGGPKARAAGRPRKKS